MAVVTAEATFVGVAQLWHRGILVAVTDLTCNTDMPAKGQWQRALVPCPKVSRLWWKTGAPSARGELTWGWQAPQPLADARACAQR